jgi:hypothetical protein
MERSKDREADMDSKRDELIALATFMPEPALWTAYVVLKTVREIYDASHSDRRAALSQQAQAAKVIDIGRWRTQHRDCATAQQEPADEIPAAEANATPGPSAPADDLRHRRIAEAEERTSRLSEQISRAAANGHPTRVAEDLFSTFLQSLSLMRDGTGASGRMHATPT